MDSLSLVKVHSRRAINTVPATSVISRKLSFSRARRTVVNPPVALSSAVTPTLREPVTRTLKIRILKQQSPVQKNLSAAALAKGASKEQDSLDRHRQKLRNLLASDPALAAALEPVIASYESYLRTQQKQIKHLKREIQQHRSHEADQVHQKLEELVQENTRLRKALRLNAASGSKQRLESALQDERAKNSELQDMLNTVEALGISVKQVCEKHHTNKAANSPSTYK